MSEIVLVRHGETTGQSSIRLHGRTDVPLNDRGRRQMERVRDALAAERYDRVVVSPLCRSRDAAAIIVGDRGPAPMVVPGFEEINFGRWEGWTFEEAAERDPENYRTFRESTADFRFPDGDTRAGFHARVEGAVPDAFGAPTDRQLGVLHKGVMKIIVATLVGMSFEEYRDLPVDLGCIYRLRHENGTWRVAIRNEVSHLGSDHISDQVPSVSRAPIPEPPKRRSF